MHLIHCILDDELCLSKEEKEQIKDEGKYLILLWSPGYEYDEESDTFYTS